MTAYTTATEEGDCGIALEIDWTQRNLFLELPLCVQSTPQPKQLLQDMTSPFGLVEELFTEDPWRLLLCAIFLNRTQRKMIDRTLYCFLQRWPTVDAVLEYARAEKSMDDMIQMVAPLGLTYKRARGIVQFCKDFVALVTAKCVETGKSDQAVATATAFSLSRDEVTGMHFCGDYAADAYQIFIRRDVQSPLKSDDHALLSYADWKRSVWS